MMLHSVYVHCLDEVEWQCYWARSILITSIVHRQATCSLSHFFVMSCACSVEPDLVFIFSFLPLFQSVDSIVQALTSQNVSEVRQSALPFGAPLLMTSGMRDVTLLYQPTYVTAYDSARHLPLWVSASVTPSVVTFPPLTLFFQCLLPFLQGSCVQRTHK